MLRFFVGVFFVGIRLVGVSWPDPEHTSTANGRVSIRTDQTKTRRVRGVTQR